MSLPTPYYDHDGITIYHGDCAEIMPHLGRFDLLLTDPPYPNGAGHFLAGIEKARQMIKQLPSDDALVFWGEMETPESTAYLVAKHVWHRSNTNRPDNYEMIYQFSTWKADKRASRVISLPVVFPGLTGCKEATGHPTQKPEKLMLWCLSLFPKCIRVLDPFAGSGTTGRACKDLGRQCVMIEQVEEYCEIAALRMAQEVLL